MELDQSKWIKNGRWSHKSKGLETEQLRIYPQNDTKRMVLAWWVKSVQASLCVPPGIFGPTCHWCALSRTFFSALRAKSDPARPGDIRSTGFHSIREHGSPASSSRSGVHKVLCRELVDPWWSASMSIPASSAGPPLSLLSYVYGSSFSQRHRDGLPQ